MLQQLARIAEKARLESEFCSTGDTVFSLPIRGAYRKSGGDLLRNDNPFCLSPLLGTCYWVSFQHGTVRCKSVLGFCDRLFAGDVLLHEHALRLHVNFG